MIESVPFVKILRVLRGKGDRDRKRHPAWAILVVRDHDWFIPVDGNLHSLFGAEPFTFDWDYAVDWARKVARIIGTTSIQCFDGTGPVEIFEQELDDA